MLCQAGHDIPNAMPLRERASAATGRDVANASVLSPRISSESTPSCIRRAPNRSMAVPPGPTTSSPMSGGRPRSRPTSLSEKLRTSCR